MEDVLEVYKRPYDPLLPVVCLDETNRQLIGEKITPLPSKPGSHKRYDYEYVRNGVADIFMMFEPLAARRYTAVTDTRTKLDFAACLRDLSDVYYPRAEKILLVMDNLNTHSLASLYEAFPPEEGADLRKGPGAPEIGGERLLKSFTSRKGGKFSLLREILPRFPRKYVKYVEVFGGAAWVFFAKRPEKHKVYNDLHGNLFNLFHCVKERPLSLLAELGFLPLCSRDEFFCLLRFLEKKEFDDAFMRQEMDLAERYLEPLQAEEVRDILTKNAQDYDVKRAAAYFKVLRLSWSPCHAGRGMLSIPCEEKRLKAEKKRVLLY